MKPIKVQVEVKENWAGKYAIFSTKKHGKIAELDWPSFLSGGVRVYPLKQNEIDGDATKHVCFSSVPQGIIGAETATKIYLMGLGYYVQIVYPKEMIKLRKQAFKEIK